MRIALYRNITINFEMLLNAEIYEGDKNYIRTTEILDVEFHPRVVVDAEEIIEKIRLAKQEITSEAEQKLNTLDLIRNQMLGLPPPSADFNVDGSIRGEADEVEPEAPGTGAYPNDDLTDDGREILR